MCKYFVPLVHIDQGSRGHGASVDAIDVLTTNSIAFSDGIIALGQAWETGQGEIPGSSRVDSLSPESCIHLSVLGKVRIGPRCLREACTDVLEGRPVGRSRRGVRIGRMRP